MKTDDDFERDVKKQAHWAKVVRDHRKAMKAPSVMRGATILCWEDGPDQWPHLLLDVKGEDFDAECEKFGKQLDAWVAPYLEEGSVIFIVGDDCHVMFSYHPDTKMWISSAEAQCFTGMQTHGVYTSLSEAYSCV